MSILLKLAFLFFIGSVFGWVLELFYRNNKKVKGTKLINPGFCHGPYLPIYGFGLCLLYLIAMLEKYINVDSILLRKLLLFVLMAVSMTLIEYIGGYISLKWANVRLWDYSDQWGNIQGIVCPLFSLYWSIIGALYYFLIHPYCLSALEWLANNLAFSFFIGLFFGVFVIDAIHSAGVYQRIREFATEKQIILHYELLKKEIMEHSKEMNMQYHFFSPFKVDGSLKEYLKEFHDKRV